MIQLKPPALLDLPADATVAFLAGSIDMGKATDWQSAVAARIADVAAFVLNPRRDDWDAGWRQSIDNPHFRGQVEWELDGLARADVIAMWFEPTSLSPITLLELGLLAESGKLVVGCPDGFWRKGNVEVVCARYQIPLVDSIDAFVTAVRARLLDAKSRRAAAVSASTTGPR